MPFGWKKEKGELEVLPPLSPAEEEFLELCLRYHTDNPLPAEELLDTVAEKEGILLEPDQRAYLLKTLRWEIEGFSCLTPLLDNEEIEEITLPSLDSQVFCYVWNKGWKKTDIRFMDGEKLVRLLNRLSAVASRRLTLTTPILDSIMPDGSRLHASIPPVSNYEFTIRKFRHRRFRLDDYLNQGMINTELAEFFRAIMQRDISVLIAGNTGSGKTSFLNALLFEVPAGERIIIIEETPELALDREHVVKLMPDREYDLSELIASTFRMRPDRLVIGEVRRVEEIRLMFEAMTGGQARATYATIHARSPQHLQRRLINMGFEDYLDALDIGVFLKRESQRRRLDSIMWFGDRPRLIWKRDFREDWREFLETV